jgi:signal transduction histidine kinase
VISEQLNYLNITIEDFKSFFQQDAEIELINLNVMINRVLLFFKDIFIEDKINVQVEGNVNLEVSFVKSELKHILMKLIFNTMYFLKSNNIEDRDIQISFNKDEEFIQLNIESKVGSVDIDLLNSLFDYNETDFEGTKKYHLGLHLVKTLIEKNFSTIYIEERKSGFSYCTRFYS